MKQISKILLIIGGITNIATAMLHIIIMIDGVSAYSYFGAPQILIELIEQNNLFIPISVMLLIITGFSIVGLYGLSGAAIIRRLPFLKTILLFIGIIYTFRGMVVFLIPFPEFTANLMQAHPTVLGMDRPMMFRDWVFSFVWLFIGIIYLIGWWHVSPVKNSLEKSGA